jgi:hypothetical protein
VLVVVYGDDRYQITRITQIGLDHVNIYHRGHSPIQRRNRVDKLQMQVNDILEPNVRIRELKKDRVNFVLENVDLSYALQLTSLS